MQVTLVKEWREAISEVSDQQSLVASLQQSAYYSHFRDLIDGWAGRLSILQVRKMLYAEPGCVARKRLSSCSAPCYTAAFLHLAVIVLGQAYIVVAERALCLESKILCAEKAWVRCRRGWLRWLLCSGSGRTSNPFFPEEHCPAMLRNSAR